MNRTVIRTVAAVIAAMVLLSCNREPSVEPDPQVEYETCRAYTEESEGVSVKMPESTVYIQGDVAKDLVNLDPNGGSVTFRTSEALKYQKVKEGDILYSAERTAEAPNGFCLRVLGVTESGGSVTYQTEPASILEAFDHLKETNILSFGNYSPDDIRVFFDEDDSEQVPQTRSMLDSFKDNTSVELKGEKYDFKSDLKSTQFKFDIWKDKSHTNNVEGELKLTLGVNVQHEILNDNTESYFSIDEGNFVLFCMAKIGVGFTVEFGKGYKPYDNPVSENDKDYERRKYIEDQAKASLVGKRFRLLDIPLNYTATKVLIDPRFVVYGEFKLDIDGKLVIEAGVENGVYAVNIANDGKEFRWGDWSYIRKVSNFRPYFDVMATAKLDASAGIGAGFNFEIPGLPVTVKDNTSPSAIGVWFGFDASQSVEVFLHTDFIAGETELTAKGSEGVVSCSASVTGVVGIKKAKLDIDWTFWPKDGALELVKIPDWNKSWTFFSPTPYNLQSEVEGSTALLSWSLPAMSIKPDRWVYVDYMLAGNPSTVYAQNLTKDSVSYGPAPDGTYRWKVEIRTKDGDKYSSAPESFEINNTSVTTGTPVLEGDSFKIPVSYSTLNEVGARGVVYSSQFSEPSADTEECVVYEGDDTRFSVTIDNLFSGLTYYARSFVDIKKNGGWFHVYGDVVTLRVEPAHIKVEPADLQFGDVEVGKTGSLPITISNDGGRDLTIFSITCADGFSSPLREGNTLVVEPGKPRTMSIRFTPTEDRPYYGTMIINSNASGDKTTVVKLSGNGVPPAKPKIAVSPSALSFDSIVAGKGYFTELPLTVTNTGNAPLTVSSIYFRDAGSPFSISGNVPHKLEKGASETINVRFMPSAPGVFSNTLVIESDASNASSISVTVKGEGVGGRPDKMLKSITLRTNSPLVDNKNVSASMVYDSQDRLVRLDADDGQGNNVSFGYGYSSDRVTVSAYGSKVVIYLDSNGRLSSANISGSGLKFRYDSSGRLSAMESSYGNETDVISFQWSGDDIYKIVPFSVDIDDEYYKLNPHYVASEYYAPLKGVDLNSLIRLFLYEIGDRFGDGTLYTNDGSYFTVTGLAGKRSDHMLSLQFTDYQASANEIAGLYCREYQGSDGQWHTLDPYNWSEGYGTFPVRGSGALSAVKCKPWSWSADSDGAVTRAVWKQVHTTSGITGSIVASKGSFDRNGDGVIDEKDAEFSFRNCNFRSSSDQEYSFVFTFAY